MKHTILALAALSLSLGAAAKTLTPDEALERATLSGPARAKAAAGMKLTLTATAPSGNPSVYVFSRPGSDGYMMLAADDAAYPLLGYSDSGSFSIDNIPLPLKWWLSEYGRQIDAANSSSASDAIRPATRKAAPAGRTAIEPMIATRWDQGAPYWDKCPLMSGVPTWTGCVATSMAQVMNYWKYPERGTGSVSYNCESLDKRLSLDFSRQPKFDWDNMRNTYIPGTYSDAEAEAVARLMVCAGYSVKMDYSSDSSGALSMNIAKALVNHFGYDAGLKYCLRFLYSSSEWESLIYEGLKTGPVLYGGDSFIGGGHSFICDGYDGEGYFHFNWGWSGMSDGYFLLDALTPGALGAGGGSGGGYSFTQDAVVGIRPDAGSAADTAPLTLVQMGSLKGMLQDDGYLYFDITGQQDPMWVNYNPETLNVQFGARVTAADNGASMTFPICETIFNLGPGYGTSPYYIYEVGQVHSRIPLSQAAPRDGAYTVTMMMRHGSDGEWIELPAAYGYSNFFSLSRSGDTYSVDNNPVSELTIVDGGLSGPTYYGCTARPWITLRNDSPIELNKGFAPILLWKDDASDENYIFFLGESVMVTLAPGEEVTREWNTDLYLMQNVSTLPDSEFLLTWFDESTYIVHDSAFLKEVEILPNPGVVKLVTPDGISIDSERSFSEKINGKTCEVHYIFDPLSIRVSAPLAIASDSQANHYEYTTYAAVTAVDDSTYEILAMSGYPMSFDSDSSDVLFSTELQMPTAELRKLYSVAVCYLYGNYFTPAYNSTGSTTSYAYFRVVDPNSAIDDVITDCPTRPAPIFNIQGIPVGSDPSLLPPGIYIQNGKKFLL